MIIGWQVTKNLDTKILKIDQSAFIYNFFKSENITNCNFVNILMKTRYFINIQKSGNYKKAKIKPYLQLIGKLIYLLYGIKLDISFIVKKLSKYNIDPQISYIKAAKKIIYYLKNTMYLSLICNSYLKNERETKIPIIYFLFELIKYKDNNYNKDYKNKKSIIRYCYFIKRAVIFWYSKK